MKQRTNTILSTCMLILVGHGCATSLPLTSARTPLTGKKNLTTESSAPKGPGPSTPPAPVPSPSTDESSPAGTLQPLPATSGSPLALPTPLTPTPAPPTVSPPPTPLPRSKLDTKSLVQERLGTVARLSFEQSRASQLSSTTGLSSSALISNNAGALISNNSGALIGNNGGALISNNGSGYRLMNGDTAISGVAEPGETIVMWRIPEKGSQTIIFERQAEPPNGYTRTLTTDDSGLPLKQVLKTILARDANQTITHQRVEELERDATGALRLKMVREEWFEANENVSRIRFEPGSCLIRYPEKGIDLDIKTFELDVTQKTGQFSYRYNKSGIQEEGTLSEVKQDASGKLYYSYGDALGYYAGASTVKNAEGTVLFKKTRELSATQVIRGYDLGEGLTMRLVRGTNNVFRGPLNLDGEKIATVGMGIFGDGTTIFDIAYLDNPKEVKRIGYGILDSINAPSQPAEPATTNNWRVTTIAGATAGFVDGDETQARFDRLRFIAPSRQTPNRFYACEFGNHRVIQIDWTPPTGDSFASDGKWSFQTIAGTGQAGYTNGPASTAQLHGPTSLAVDTDDTLYIAELTGNRIRKLRKDTAGIWQTSNLAGNGQAGFADANADNASFYGPTGLALAGRTLYITDQGNRRLRTLNPYSTPIAVQTVAGSGDAGTQDGVGTAARFDQPVGLTVENEQNLLITDAKACSLRRFDIPSRGVSTIIQAMPDAKGAIDGPLPQANLFKPWGILADNGNILVGRVDLRIIRNDTVRTLAGTNTQGNQDGDGNKARFTSITGMIRLFDGSYLLCDSNRLRRVIPSKP